MKIQDMTAEQLIMRIRDTIDETLEEYFGDPDEGREIKPEVKQRLLEIRKRREEGQKGISAAEAYTRLGLNRVIRSSASSPIL